VALMDEAEAPSSAPPKKYLSVRQAAFHRCRGKRVRDSRASAGTAGDVQVGH
jgi:hypothetical protein